MCLYETWRVGDHQLDLHGCAILLHGLATRECHRGSQGVGIALDPAGREAWERAGCVVEWLDDLRSALCCLDGLERELEHFY